MGAFPLYKSKMVPTDAFLDAKDSFVAAQDSLSSMSFAILSGMSNSIDL